MTVFHLIRHGENDLVGRAIAGRTPGVHLNANGRQQAEAVGAYLAARNVDVLISSPLERACETAGPLARRLGLELQISERLNEVNFGDWTMKSNGELDRMEQWRQWNTFRSGGRIPGGESMLEVQSRMVAEMEHLRRKFEGRQVALFSHADPIRAALVYYLGMSLDLLLRLQISVGSISTLAIDDWSVQAHCINLVPPACKA